VSARAAAASSRGPVGTLDALAYRPRASPLHAARAWVGASYCGAIAVATLVLNHPLALVALGAAVALAARGARVGSAVARAARPGAALALFIVVMNPIAVRDGLTVLARLGHAPTLGQIDITLEAIANGGVLGLRALVLVTCFGLATAAVDPDQLLRSVRRVSFHAALTATLATRMVPVLARDSRRLAEGQRCRPDQPEGGLAARAGVVRAVAAGALDRALDVAATLEMRGYGSRRRAPRVGREPWSRHDVAFLAAGVATLAVALGARAFGALDFSPYPKLVMSTGVADLACAAALLLVAVAPFTSRRGIG
jgi:energy-coupling factor transport system permease protein